MQQDVACEFSFLSGISRIVVQTLLPSETVLFFNSIWSLLFATNARLDYKAFVELAKCSEEGFDFYFKSKVSRITNEN